MENLDIKNQMTVRQTELNLTSDTDQRKKIMNQLAILKYRLEIDNPRHKIEQLQIS